VAGTCECRNEPSGYIKCGEFRDYLRTGWLLQKGSAPCFGQSRGHPQGSDDKNTSASIMC